MISSWTPSFSAGEEGILRRLVRSSSRTWLIAATALTLAACTTAGSTTPGSRGPTPSRAEASPVVLAATRLPLTVPPAVTSPPRVTASPWRPSRSAAWAHRLLLHGAFTQLQGSGHSLYALESVPDVPTNLGRLVRIDLRERSVWYSRRFIVNPGTMAITRGGIWIVGATWVSRNDEHVGQAALYRFNARTLQLESEHRLGNRPASAAQAPGGDLWLSEGSTLRLVNPVRWHVLQKVTVGAQVLQIAPTPSGRRLYVESVLQNPTRLVIEAIETNGEMVACRVLSKDWQGGQLAVTDSGVWLALGVAHSGGVEHLTSDLGTGLSFGNGEQAGSGQEQQDLAFLPNGVRVTIQGRVAWITATNTVTCLNAGDGAFLARQPMGHQYPGPVITAAPTRVRGRYFGIAGEGGGPTTGIMRFRPPTSCLG